MSTIEGKIVALSVSVRKGIAKTNVPSRRVITDWGLEGDVHAGNWHRQVSLLAVESIDKMRALGLSVRPGAFAENITTEGVVLETLEVGDVLQLGGVKLEITQIGKECHSRCAIYTAAGDCVMPREGIFARVITGGLLTVGDVFHVLRAARVHLNAAVSVPGRE